MFKPIQLAAADIGQPQPDADMSDADMRQMFKVLHGWYGNLFLSKFATGQVDEETKEDRGIANAREMWRRSLRRFDGDTIKLALRRCKAQHAEFPPSLPQFERLCDAAKPRPVWTPPVPTQPALEMSEALRAERRAEARAKATEAARRQIQAAQPTGLDLLKQAIANAVATAGGDEAATLARLDRELVGSAA